MAWEEVEGERGLSGRWVTGAGAAEMAWEEATEGERGLSGRWELLGLELRNGMGRGYGGGARFGRSLRGWGWSCRNGMGRGYGGGARFGGNGGGGLSGR